MTRVFKVAVHKHIGGELHSFLPGDVLPEEFSAEDHTLYKYTEEFEEVEDTDAPVEGEEVKRPRKNSRDRDAWVAYAESRGVLVDDEADVDDIRDGLEDLDNED